MKKRFIFIFGLFFLFACEKEEARTTKKDYSTFLAYNVNSLFGVLENKSISWSFGSNFQGISGYENGSGVCDPTDPTRTVLFGLTSEGGGNTYFRFYSPVYNATTDFENIFELGEKRLGNFKTDFYLSIFIDNTLYESSRNLSNQIEILKKQELRSTDGFVRYRVWFRLNAILKPICGCEKPDLKLTDGMLLAEFFGVKL